MTKPGAKMPPPPQDVCGREGVPELSRSQVLELLERLRKPYHAGYLAMYSSLLGGIVREPALMLVPVDDHVVHRGDGVFETAKCVAGRLYQLGPHLERLAASAAAIGLSLPAPVEEITRIVVATVRAGASPDCFVRLLATRGPGGFTPNPFECPASQLYVVAYRAAPYDEVLFERGVRCVTSRVPVKPGIFATIKSCNYLPNVLMKKEALERGAHYALAVDERGFLAEGAAENFCLVSAAGELLFPRFERILHGITVSRVAELAPAHGLGETGFTDLRLEDAFAASEMILLGTSFDALPVVDLDGRPIGSARPGPVYLRVRELIRRDITENPQASVPVFV